MPSHHHHHNHVFLLFKGTGRKLVLIFDSLLEKEAPACTNQLAVFNLYDVLFNAQGSLVSDTYMKGNEWEIQPSV
jgi:hypothetical protein